VGFTLSTNKVVHGNITSMKGDIQHI